MRLSRMLLIAVLAVLASLTTAASPALAQSSAATVLPTVCQERVCLTVTVESATEVYLMARVNVSAARCGHFAASLMAAGRTIQAASNSTCAAPPLWCTRLIKPAGPGSVRVWFVSEPETPGEPVVFF